jgi:hypothetical protein
MRMDESLMLLAARASLLSRSAARNGAGAGEGDAVRTTVRGDGKREVHFKGGFNELVKAARSLRGTR